MTTKTTVKVYEIGKCPVQGCRCRVRFEGEKIVTVSKWVNHLGYQKCTTSEHATKTLWHADLFCVEHRRRLGVATIAARLNETPCDARCTSAKGFKCECSCGGANHGKDMELISF